ncbi:MAG: hypothetical protein IKO35_02875 [Elusimicrobiaceae bacterium]|nr:hypothetical protein [Elusimicrobiaceae bacterium]
MWQIHGLIFGCSLLMLVVFLARQEGKKAARLAALKREAKEIARAQSIADSVYRMSADSVRNKLKQTK